GRAPGQLVLVLQRLPGRHAGGQLLWAAAAGLGAGGELTSSSTDQRGLISAVDLAPTILTRLDLSPLPVAVLGRPATVSGPLDGAALCSLMARLRALPD